MEGNKDYTLGEADFFCAPDKCPVCGAKTFVKYTIHKKLSTNRLKECVSCGFHHDTEERWADQDYKGKKKARTQGTEADHNQLLIELFDVLQEELQSLKQQLNDLLGGG
jgi:Zn ribbon nucleic-acid-binding protein